MRLLYAVCHPTLRSSDISLFLATGFEVVPALVHIQFRGRHRINPRPLDNPLTKLNCRWKKACTVPDEDIEKIQKIDFYKIDSHPFTQVNDHVNLVENAGFNQSGCVSPEEAALINKYFDVLVVESFPNVPAAALEWFHGIVTFRIFGNEDPQFKLWRLYKAHFFSQKSANFFKFRNRYLSLPVFDALNNHEGHELITEEKCFLPSVVMEEIEVLTQGQNWLGEKSTPSLVTNLSRLDVSESWRKYYYELKKSFSGLPIDIYGKNNLDSDFCRKDPAIKGMIKDYKTSLAKYCSYRVFCNIGTLKHHSQYPPFECVAMGIPVLYHCDGAIAEVLNKIYSIDDLKNAGMCQNLAEMRLTAEKCLQDFSFAAGIAERQRTQFYVGFGNERALLETRRFQSECERKIQLNKKSLSPVIFSTPTKNATQRIFWLSDDRSLREVELPHWLKAGFEIIPLKMNFKASHSTADFVDSSSEKHSTWRENSTLSVDLIELIRDFMSDVYLRHRYLPQENIAILNQYVGTLYFDGHPKIAMTLLAGGYHGQIVYRISPRQYKLLQDNFEWQIYLKILRRHKNIKIAATFHREADIGRSFQLGTKSLFIEPLRLASSGFIPQNSTPLPRIATSIVGIIDTAKIQYAHFIHFFGHLPYFILGENHLDQLKDRLINDTGIVDLPGNTEESLQKLSSASVYLDSVLGSDAIDPTAFDALLIGTPLIFHHHSSLAAALLKKISADQLYQAGMFKSFEEMSICARNCLGESEIRSLLISKQKDFKIVVESALAESELALLQKDIAQAAPVIASWKTRFSERASKRILSCLQIYLRLKKLFMLLNRLTKVSFHILFVVAGFRADSTQLKSRLGRRVRHLLGVS